MHINIVSTMALVTVSRCPGALHCPLIAVTLTRILQLRTTQSADTHRPSFKLSYISYIHILDVQTTQLPTEYWGE